LFDENLPDGAVIQESVDFTQLLKIACAMTGMFIAGILVGFAYMNMAVIPSLCH
jgi:hypothetical protein